MTTDVETEAEGMTCGCGHCDAEVPEAEWEAGDGLCAACLAAHFSCKECGERTHRDDAHATVKAHCESCGDSVIEARHQEALDAAADELRELVESVIDSGDLAAIRKALKSLKRLSQ